MAKRIKKAGYSKIISAPKGEKIITAYHIANRWWVITEKGIYGYKEQKIN